MAGRSSKPGQVEAGDAHVRGGKAPRRSSVPSMWNLAGMGIDLSAAVAGFTLIGWWADKHWQTSPRYTLVGVILGLIGGMYNMIRRALRAGRAATSDYERRDGEDS